VLRPAHSVEISRSRAHLLASTLSFGRVSHGSRTPRHGVCCLRVVCFSLLVAAAQAEVIPPSGLAPGSQYQLIFVTANKMCPADANIADYNALVAAEAALSAALPQDPTVTWSAVVSTAAVNARTNAVYFGLPVYNTRGILVADAANGLYSAPLFSPIKFDQYGNDVGFICVDTGSNPDGTAYTHAELGSNNGIMTGNPTLTGNLSSEAGWLMGWQFNTKMWSLGTYPPCSYYALSSPITVSAPEPSTVALLAVGAIAVLACMWRRRA
jgi:hypothetical protein